MPPNNTIVARLTADPRDMQRGFRIAGQEAVDLDRTFARLDARTKRMSMFSGTGGGMSGVRGISREAAQGLQEAGRAAEDFAVSFGLNGLQGGIRGATNNITRMAEVMGGPLAGAIAGFTAAGVTFAMPWIASLFEATKNARDFGKELEAIAAIAERSQKAIEKELGFKQLLRGTDDSRGAGSEMQKRIDEVETLNAKIHDLNRLRQPLMAKANQPAFGEQQVAERNAAAEADHKLFMQGLEMMRERVRLEKEVNTLREKRNELQKQELGADAAKIIRGFQVDDLKGQIGDNERLQNIVQGRMRGLGDKGDPLEGLNIPDEMRGRLEGLLADEHKGGARFADVATAGSQSLLRAQEQAKQAAKASQERQKMIDELRDIARELKDQRKKLDTDLDDVNLN